MYQKCCYPEPVLEPEPGQSWTGSTTLELSELTDNLWCGLIKRYSGAKSNHVAAAVPDGGKELAEAVAALNVQPKGPQHKKSAAKGGKSQGKLCHIHKKYGDNTWKCMDPVPARGWKMSSGSSSSRHPHVQT